MKKRLFILSLFLIISGCSLKNHQPRQKIEGTISYYNFEQERGSGEETEYGKSHSAVYLNLDPKFHFVISNPENKRDKETIGKILIGCISGDKEILHRDILQIKYPTKQTVGANTREIINTKTIKLPKNLDQQKIEAKITLPIDLYTLNNDLPDQGRVNTCFAHSDIKNIKAIK